MFNVGLSTQCSVADFRTITTIGIRLSHVITLHESEHARSSAACLYPYEGLWMPYCRALEENRRSKVFAEKCDRLEERDQGPSSAQFLETLLQFPSAQGRMDTPAKSCAPAGHLEAAPA
jgi:hypothetical protein